MDIKKHLIVGLVVLLLLSIISISGASEKNEANDDHIDNCLNAYSLARSSTVKDFKYTLDNSLKEMKNPFMFYKAKRNVASLYKILNQMGIKDYMTIQEMITIIRNEPGLLAGCGYNLLCEIDIFGVGTTFPVFRAIKAIYATWSIYYDEGNNHAHIWGVLEQYTEEPCGGNIYLHLGTVTCLGHAQPIPLPVAVVEGVCLYSFSDVPYV